MSRILAVLLIVMVGVSACGVKGGLTRPSEIEQKKDDE
jgi:predicted small lipoprotein YifL